MSALPLATIGPAHDNARSSAPTGKDVLMGEEVMSAELLRDPVE